MVATFLDDSKPQIHLNSEFAQLQTSSILLNFIQFGKCWRNFLGLNPKGPYLSLEEKKKRQLLCPVHLLHKARAFHVAGVQRQQRNVQNSVMHVQICCFVNKNLLRCCRSSSVAFVVGFVGATMVT